MIHKKSIFTIIALWLFLGISTLFSESIRIMPLGNSITYGITYDTTPDNELGGYRAPLYHQLKNANFTFDFVGTRRTGSSVLPAFDIDNEGHPDHTSYDIAQNIDTYLAATQPNVILLHIGTNDHSSSTSGVESILNEIDHYERISGHTIRVIVAMIINRQGYDDTIAVFNNNLAKLITSRWENGDILTLVNMEQDAALTSQDYANNSHPNNTGYAKIANVWFNELGKPYVEHTSAPVTHDDEILGDTGSTVSTNITNNDTDLQNDMNVSSVNFIGGEDTDGDKDNDKLTVAGQGIWTVDEIGIVIFVPEKNFTDDPTAIQYTIQDNEKEVSNASTISINYTNHSLEAFPTSLVDASYIESTTLNEASNSIEFITRIPDDGITF